MSEVVNVDGFQPRWYQRDLINALEHYDKKKFVIVWPRRAGKDVAALNLMLRQAFKRVGVYYYLYPKYDQCRRAIWDSILITGEKFLDFIPKRLIAKKNNVEMKIVLVNGSIIQFNGADNADCYDDKTEVLTDNGWMLFQELIDRKHENIKVATLKDGSMVYEKPLDYIKQSYTGPMYSIKNKAMDMLVTPNHKFYVRSPKGVYKFKRISDPTIKYYSIPSTSNWVGNKCDSFTFPDTDITIDMMDYMALLGIYLSEGSSCYRKADGYEVCIAQTKPMARVKIEKLLDRCSIKYSKQHDRYVFYSKDMYNYFSQFGKQPERFIPREVLDLDKVYLQELFDWLVLGDGTIHKNGSIYYYSCSKRLMDDVQELILKIGYSGYINIKAKAGSSGGTIRGRQITYKHDLYSIRVRKSKFKRFCSSKTSYIQKEDYSGDIYCVTVPSGVIKVRRNDKECWSGNSLRGTNPVGVVFSEYSRVNHPEAYNGVVAPILAANDGWVVFISTPNGHNEFYNVYKHAQEKQDDDWYTKILTVYETKHVSEEVLKKEKERMSDELFLQEYFCSFEIANTGAYYAKYVHQAYADRRIGYVPHDSSYEVHTAWDLGYHSPSVIIFYQVIGRKICVIDLYHKSNEDLSHYVSVLNSYTKTKNYNYGKHFVPHDAKKHELGNGKTRLKILAQLGIATEVLDKSGLHDGIEVVKHTFKRIFINDKPCSKLLDALEHYSRKWDPVTKRFTNKDKEDWATDFCFVGDTNILTEHGNVKIKDIVPGMKVVTPTGIKNVLKVHKKYSKNLCDVSVGDAIITCTPEHKIFTGRGLVRADSLCYNDVCENYSNTRSVIWKAIYKYYSKVRNLTGFKKDIISLNVNPKHSLMDMFIEGMENIIKEKNLNIMNVHHCTEQYGNIIMEKLMPDMLYTTLMETLITTQLKTLNVCLCQHIPPNIVEHSNLGQNLINAKSCLKKLDQELLSGIRVVRGENGIENMQRDHYQFCKEYLIEKNVSAAEKNLAQDKSMENTALINVNQKHEDWLEKILSVAPVVFAKLYLKLTNIFSRKHVVKNVRLYQCEEQKAVYDLTVEDDNCYYANGYLVSNCDSFRYMCLSLSYIDTNERSPEEFDKRYRELVYGSDTTLPPIFRG